MLQRGLMSLSSSHSVHFTDAAIKVLKKYLLTVSNIFQKRHMHCSLPMGKKHNLLPKYNQVRYLAGATRNKDRGKGLSVRTQNTGTFRTIGRTNWTGKHLWARFVCGVRRCGALECVEQYRKWKDCRGEETSAWWQGEGYMTVFICQDWAMRIFLFQHMGQKYKGTTHSFVCLRYIWFALRKIFF